MASEPKTLQEAVVHFADPQNCVDYVVARRWPNGVVCPTCGNDKVSFLKNQNKWQCSSHHAKRQFSVKTGTIFEDSPITLDKWLAAMWLVVNCKNGISSCEIARDLGITQKSAWYMMHRIRRAMYTGTVEKFSGHVEVDETFIGGKARNMHVSKRRKSMIACVDVFCGIGGLTHGLLRGGIRVVAGIDVDPHCRFPYEANNKGAKFIQKDIREVSGAEVTAMFEDAPLTMLAGCAPCQPFSTYSRSGRELRKDTKWNLLDDFARIISESRPDFVTMENVPQLINHPVFPRFLLSLRDYQPWWKVVECAEYGVPQTRKRLVLLASKHGPVRLPDPSVIDEDGPTTVRRAIAHLKRLRAGESDPEDRLHAACSLTPLNLRRIRASLPGGTWRDWDRSLIAACHLKDSGDTYPSVYGRMEWDTLAPTITTQCFGYGNGRFGHPEQDRAITLREAALLQTFPRSYKFLETGERVRYNILGRLIGNAVPVRIGEIVARSFLERRKDYVQSKAYKKDRPITLSPETVAKCDAPDQFQNFDRMFRAVIAVPKSAVEKEEAKWKRQHET